MSEKRTGIVKYHQKSGRFRIVYESNDFDYDELTSGTVFWIRLLGVWKKSRIEFNSQKDCYYAVDLEIPLKENLEWSLFPQK